MPQYVMQAVNGLDAAEFAAVWEEGKAAVLNNMPWAAMGKESLTEQEKLVFFYGLYTMYFGRPNGIVWKSALDGKTVAINAGVIEGDMIHWELALIGVDQNGGHSWFKADWATVARDAFWDSVGVEGWKMKIYDESSVNTIARYYEQNESDELAKGDSITRSDPAEKGKQPGMDSVFQIDVRRSSANKP